MQATLGSARQGVPTAEELADREERETEFCVIEELFRLSNLSDGQVEKFLYGLAPVAVAC